MIVVGIDVGGTFTDVTAVDEETGAVSLTKVPSTSNDEGRAVRMSVWSEICRR